MHKYTSPFFNVINTDITFCNINYDISLESFLILRSKPLSLTNTYVYRYYKLFKRWITSLLLPIASIRNSLFAQQLSGQQTIRMAKGTVRSMVQLPQEIAD